MASVHVGQAVRLSRDVLGVLCEARRPSCWTVDLAVSSDSSLSLANVRECPLLAFPDFTVSEFDTRDSIFGTPLAPL